MLEPVAGVREGIELCVSAVAQTFVRHLEGETHAFAPQDSRGNERCGGCDSERERDTTDRPVRAPGCDQAGAVLSKIFRRRKCRGGWSGEASEPTRKWKAEKRLPQPGQLKKKIYQLRAPGAGVIMNLRITEGCGTLRTTSLATRCGWSSAALHATAAPQS